MSSRVASPNAATRTKSGAIVHFTVAGIEGIQEQRPCRRAAIDGEGDDAIRDALVPDAFHAA
jgi:hypothetical protein